MINDGIITRATNGMLLVLVREKFTNLLVRIATYEANGNISSDENNEYSRLLEEAEHILQQYPEWQDIANQWISKK